MYFFLLFPGKDLAIWLCDDDLISLEEECSVISDAKKPPGYYVNRPSGLFPAPLPQDSDICSKAVKIFRFLGIFLAKTLQDNRLVDLPLSNFAMGTILGKGFPQAQVHYRIYALKQQLLGVILCFFMHLRWPWLLRFFGIML